MIKEELKGTDNREPRRA